ncbi:MAG TPA: HlyD family secretion protein [Polyangiaceae bacterium]|nr:HlyD family secretion protein [Polyangiaceae bacterium]
MKEASSPRASAIIDEAPRPIPHLAAAPGTEPAPEENKPAKKRKAPRVFLGLLALAAVVGAVLWWLGRGKESTDDAQVEGHVVTVSVRTPGQVLKVLVTDNQFVKKDDVLLELDLEELRARLAVAKADRLAAEASLALAQAQLDLTQRNADANLRQARGGISQAASGVAVTKAQLEQAQADIANAESRVQLANKDLTRIRELFAQGSVSQAELDARQAAADQASAGLEQARARHESTRALISGNYGGVEQAQGRMAAALSAPQQVRAAQAQVQLSQARLEQLRATERLAELNLEYGSVRAPVAGIVSRKNIEAGSLVSPERPVLAIVPLDDVWVVANFKEDQIGKMKPGQPTRITFDTYSGRTLNGQVESIAAGTGARFALLPPDNATGNYVKVVQRIPVRIKLDPEAGLTLRPGMSAEVTVRVE